MQFYVRRTFTHVHGCKSSHLDGNTATRFTKTSIMTVHVNTIMQAVPSQRRLSLTDFFSLSESDGGLISSSTRVHGPRNCSMEGS